MVFIHFAPEVAVYELLDGCPEPRPCGCSFQVFIVHLFVHSFWLWTSIQQIIDSNLQGEMDKHHKFTLMLNPPSLQNKTSDVVMQQHSCKLPIMDILMPETC